MRRAGLGKRGGPGRAGLRHGQGPAPVRAGGAGGVGGAVAWMQGGVRARELSGERPSALPLPLLLALLDLPSSDRFVFVIGFDLEVTSDTI